MDAELHAGNFELVTKVTDVPPAVARAGGAGQIAWYDFFCGMLANGHTRIAYLRAVRRFLDWPQITSKQLHEITAGDVGTYLRKMEGSLPKQKQHLSALRRFFDLLVERHICAINPASTARTERHVVTEGKTPRITEAQVQALLNSIDTDSPIGLRDRAIIGILMWTGVRAGSVARLRHCDLFEAEDQWMLRFDEKRRRCRDIPVRSDLWGFLRDYLAVFDGERTLADPLFCTALGNSRRFSQRAISGHDICRMIKRRVARAGLARNLSPHAFRVGVATDLLEQGTELSDGQSYYLLSLRNTGFNTGISARS